MKYIRIGNDINVVWSILTDEGAPYNLGNVTLRMSCAGVVAPVEDYSVVGNKVSFTFYGKDQRSIGIYTLTLVENDGEVNMHTVDACKVFKLVNSSCEANDVHTINPEVESLALISQVEFVKGWSGGGGTTIVVDSALSLTSANPVENRVVTAAINEVAENVTTETVRATKRENEVLAEAKSYTRQEIGNINIPSIDGLVNEEQLAEGVKQAKDYADEQILNIEIPKVDLSNYATIEYVNNQAEGLNQGIISAHSVIEVEAERAVAKETELAGEIQRVENIAGNKQDKLVSGTTIRTINGQPILGSGNINITAEASTTVIEPNVKFAKGNEGNTDIANGVTPVDAAMYPFFSPNRLNFMNDRLLDIEFTRNRGETWHPYPNDRNDITNSIPEEYNLLSKDTKTLFVTDIDPKGVDLYLGARKGTQEASDMLRITITSSASQLYFSLKKIFLQVCTGGLKGMSCDIDVMNNGSDTFYNFKEGVGLSGWTGWNSIALNNVFGGAATQTNQYNKIRITIYGDSIDSNYIGKTDIRVNGLRMFGETMWSGTNTLQKTGHLYEINVYKKATFPGQVEATAPTSTEAAFVGLATSVINGAISEAKLGNSAVTEAKIKDNAVTKAKLSTDVQAEMRETQQQLSEIKEVVNVVGEEGYVKNLTTSDYSGFVYNGTKFITASSSYNSFVFRLYKDSEFKLTNNTQLSNGAAGFSSAFTFENEPAIGDVVYYKRIYDSDVFTNGFIPEENENYIIINIYIPSYSDSYFTHVSSARGIFKDIENLNKANLPLKNKNILCLGDSITEFNYQNKRYSDYLAEKTGANVINGGIGGTQISRRLGLPTEGITDNNQAYACLDLPSIAEALNTEDFSLQEAAAEWLVSEDNPNKTSDDNTSIIERLKNIDLSVIDIVTIFIGTNDFEQQLGGLGDLGKKGNALNISQGFRCVIENLLTKNPNLRIYYFSPMPRYFGDIREEWDDAEWCDNKTSSANYKFPDMVDHLINLAKYYKIPVCDMYRTMGINQWNIKSIMSEILSDGTHPYRGFKMIANKIESFIVANNNLNV